MKPYRKTQLYYTEYNHHTRYMKVFVSALRKQFYPLGYKEKSLIEWKGIKLRKGETMQ
jgi:hypothetical protein